MKRVPFYPLCIAAFVLLGIFAANRGQAYFSELLAPLAIALTGALVLTALISLLMRSVHRGALLAGCVVFCFLTYNFWVNALWGIHPSSRLRVPYHVAVLAIQVILLGVVAFLAMRRMKDPRGVTESMNWFACILLACPLLLMAGQKAWAELYPRRAVETETDKALLIAKLDPNVSRPDIYFIVLDAHGRNDILREQYHFDDSAFLQHLRDKGFYVADQSTSNYMWTRLSIPSTVNMRYLNDLPADGDRRGQCAELLHHSALAAELKTLGYRTVAFEAMDSWLSLKNANVYYSITDHLGITPLQQLILDTSVLSEVGGAAVKSELVLDQFHLKREMMRFKFSLAPEAARLRGPKYVFLHVFEPHTPFVFAADGSDPESRGYGSMFEGLNSEITNQQYHDWYREQAIYTDQQTSRLIDAILANSAKPPVIVLIGDHGPRSGIKADPSETDLRECLSNLTAVYLPGQHNRGLYPSITPVNLFRVVLDDYFHANLPLLADKSYYSYTAMFQLRDVTADVNPAAAAASTQPARAPNPNAAKTPAHLQVPRKGATTDDAKIPLE